MTNGKNGCRIGFSETCYMCPLRTGERCVYKEIGSNSTTGSVEKPLYSEKGKKNERRNRKRL